MCKIPRDKRSSASNCCARARPGSTIKLFATLLIILTGLGGRSALDKVLALRGGSELVALWAQLGSVIELVAAVAMAGIGTGLTVLVVQAVHSGEQHRLLREATKTGLAVSAPLVVLLPLLAWWFRIADGPLPVWLLGVAAVTGWVAIVPGMLNSYWLGLQRRDLMIWLALASALLPLGAALTAPAEAVLALTAIASAVPALAVVLILGRERHRLGDPGDGGPGSRALRRYIVPGVAIGILSPASMVAARAIVSEAMSWQDAGLLQALWRVSDWVTSVAAGLLSVYFLPKLTAAVGTPAFHAEMKRAAKMTLGPAALAFALLLAFQGPILEWLYDETFRVRNGTVALFFAGSLVRIVAWVPLFGLYAQKRTGAITVGEFLSLPLFALLLELFSRSLTLETAGAAWLASYLAYAAFNLWLMMRTR